MQIVTLAVFSEADGNALLNALTKVGAKIITKEEVNSRENKQHTTISRKTRVITRNCLPPCTQLCLQ